MGAAVQGVGRCSSRADRRHGFTNQVAGVVLQRAVHRRRRRRQLGRLVRGARRRFGVARRGSRAHPTLRDSRRARRTPSRPGVNIDCSSGLSRQRPPGGGPSLQDGGRFVRAPSGQLDRDGHRAPICRRSDHLAQWARRCFTYTGEGLWVDLGHSLDPGQWYVRVPLLFPWLPSSASTSSQPASSSSSSSTKLPA